MQFLHNRSGAVICALMSTWPRQDDTACIHKPRLFGNRSLPQTMGSMLRRSSAAVATSRAGHRPPRSVREGHDPPPLKWSDLRYVSDIQEDCNGKEALQA